MSYKVIVTPEADSDVSRIYTWLSARSTDGARRWYAEWFKALSFLKENPFLFGFAPENDFVDAEIRQVIFRTRRGLPYRALFWSEGNAVHILHVRGPGQSPMLPGELE